MGGVFNRSISALVQIKPTNYGEVINWLLADCLMRVLISEQIAISIHWYHIRLGYLSDLGNRKRWDAGNSWL